MEYRRMDKTDGHMVLVYDLEKCLEAIKARNEDNEDTIERLQEEIKVLKSEHYKDEQLQEMKKRLEKMQKDYWRGFPLTEEEEQDIKRWQDKHNAEVHDITTDYERQKAAGCIGGQFTYEFTVTSIGILGQVRCGACGEKHCFCGIL